MRSGPWIHVLPRKGSIGTITEQVYPYDQPKNAHCFSGLQTPNPGYRQAL
jgi:hypothetical protein